MFIILFCAENLLNSWKLDHESIYKEKILGKNSHGFSKIWTSSQKVISNQIISMTRGAQREREKVRAQKRNEKHKEKGAAGNANERRERDAEIMRQKQMKKQQQQQDGGGQPK